VRRQGLLARPGGLAGAAILAAMALAALAAPFLASAMGHDPFAPDLLGRYGPADTAHPLGTDELGRDVLLRLLYGARVSLTVGIAAALAAAAIGTLLGLLAAWTGGALDAVLMRLADGMLALPALPLLVVLAAVDPARIGLPADGGAADMLRIVTIVALFGWVGVARFARAAALSVLRRDFVRAAVALGVPGGVILRRHVATNVAGPVAVATTLAVGHTILVESTLSFLGLGIQPPTPSWGGMLANAQEMVFAAPLLALWPGLCILLTVVACNLVGDALQDWLDPRS
jgi:peptide/nickel transport system permease protein